jgi:electron transfer flavoprotein beta subunit
MQNMRLIMPALQKAVPAKFGNEGLAFAQVELPKQKRDTRIEKNMSAEAIAQEIVEWIKA